MNFTPKKEQSKQTGRPPPAMAKGVGAVSSCPSSTPPLRITQASALTNTVKSLPLAGQLGALIVQERDPNKEFLTEQWVKTCGTNGNPIIIAVVEGSRAAVTITADEETIDCVHDLNPDARRVAPDRLKMEFSVDGLDMELLELHLDTVSL